MQKLFRGDSGSLRDLMPDLSITTTSPGSTDLVYSAPMMSNAQVSDASRYASLCLPMLRGLNPKGSRAAMSISGVRKTKQYAPTSLLSASMTDETRSVSCDLV